MMGVIGIIAALTVLSLSMLITRIAAIALSLTGLSDEAARFQARSAFTGTGFTTAEAENVVDHPIRRRIIMMLMVARSAGFVSIIISIILSFGSEGAHELSRLYRLSWLIAGVAVLWMLARSKKVEKWLSSIIKKALNHWTDLEARDYAELLKLSGEYTVREIQVQEDDWVSNKKLGDCELHHEGILILGIYRHNGEYLGAPTLETAIEAGDTMILYGRAEALEDLDVRKAGAEGEARHKAASSDHRQEQAGQAEKDQQYEEKRQKQDSD